MKNKNPRRPLSLLGSCGTDTHQSMTFSSAPSSWQLAGLRKRQKRGGFSEKGALRVERVKEGKEPLGPRRVSQGFGDRQEDQKVCASFAIVLAGQQA
jgi:hypothetical protein